MNITTLSQTVADAAGKAQKSQGLSTESFVISLTVYGVILLFSIGGFAIYKDWKPAASQPRCLEDNGIEFLPKGWIVWIRHLIDLLQDERFLIPKLGLDSLLVLRLLKTIIKMLLPAALLTLPVLLPLYYTADRSGVVDLDKLSISNIHAGQELRCWIIALVAFILDIYFCRLLLLEFRNILNLRQEYLHQHCNDSMHLLITELPHRMWDKDVLAHLLSSFTRGPVEVILPRESECEDLERRASALSVKLDAITNTRSEFKLELPLPAGMRNLSMKELRMRRQAQKLRKDAQKIKSVAIVYFPDLFSAHLALQVRAVPVPTAMEFHVVGDGILASLSGVYESRLTRSARSLGLTSIIIFLSVFWAIPIAMTGLLSQLKYLDSVIPSLESLSNAQLSIIQGIVPQLALSLLMWLLPLRQYFIFLYTQVFVVVSISSSVTTMIPEFINDFRSITAILAQNLPKSSNYFYPYMVLQAVSHCVMVLFQLPQSLYYPCTVRHLKKEYLKTVEWSSVYAVFTNLVSICIVFAVISPILLVVGLVMFAIFLLVYSYQAIYVLGGDPQSPGVLYWEALHQIFVGLYTKNMFLIGLFALQNNVGPMVVAILLLGGVALTQRYVRRNFGPLVKYISAIRSTL
ncbi:putative DUF221 membrane protein [Aspergillus stella-maris]|uniref:putative DUF221 membrane protein n=1 Tax=Aspergillus stella-maris TaxID=1810926 RepID=UPI003CCDB15B